MADESPAVQTPSHDDTESEVENPSEVDSVTIAKLKEVLERTPVPQRDAIFRKTLETQSSDVIGATIPLDTLVNYLDSTFRTKPIHARSRKVVALQIVHARTAQRLVRAEEEIVELNEENDQLEVERAQRALQQPKEGGPRRSLTYGPTTTTLTASMPSTTVIRPVAPSHVAAQIAAQVTPDQVLAPPVTVGHELYQLPLTQQSIADFSFPSYQPVPQNYFQLLNQQDYQPSQSTQYQSQGNQFPSQQSVQYVLTQPIARPQGPQNFGPRQQFQAQPPQAPNQGYRAQAPQPPQGPQAPPQAPNAPNAGQQPATFMEQSIHDLLLHLTNSQQTVVNRTFHDPTSQIPIFRGNMVDQPQRWIAKIEQISMVQNTPPADILQYGLKQLRGAAKHWQTAVGIHYEHDWQAYKAAFLERFQIPFDSTLWEEMLKTIKQMANESISDYLQRRLVTVRLNTEIQNFQHQLPYLLRNFANPSEMTHLAMAYHPSLNSLFTKAGILDRTSETYRKTVIANAIKNSQNDEEKESQAEKRPFSKSDQPKGKTPFQKQAGKVDQPQAGTSKPPFKKSTIFDPNFKHSFTPVNSGKMWPIQSEPYKNDTSCRFCKKTNHKVDKCFKLRATCQKPQERESHFIDTEQSDDDDYEPSVCSEESEPDEISDDEL